MLPRFSRIASVTKLRGTDAGSSAEGSLDLVPPGSSARFELRFSINDRVAKLRQKVPIVEVPPRVKVVELSVQPVCSRRRQRANTDLARCAAPMIRFCVDCGTLLMAWH